MIAFQFLAALAALYLPRQTNKVPHCDHMGPHLRDWAPIGSPFLFQGTHFLIYGIGTREKSMQPLSNGDHLITCDNTTSTNESHASLSVKSVLLQNDPPPPD